MNGYISYVRPLILPDTVTNVTLDLTLLQVISMVRWYLQLIMI